MSMQRSLSIELPSLIKQQVRIRGWIHTLRSLGKIHFLIVRDRKGLSQVVIQDKEEFNKIKQLQVGTVVTVTGEVSENAQTNLLVEIILFFIKKSH